MSDRYRVLLDEHVKTVREIKAHVEMLQSLLRQATLLDPLLTLTDHAVKQCDWLSENLPFSSTTIRDKNATHELVMALRGLARIIEEKGVYTPL